MKKIKVALIQLKTKPYALDDNVNLALKFMQKAVKKGVELIVLPELFDCGYFVADKDLSFASDLSKANKTFQILSDFALNHHIYIIACGIEKANKKLYDSAYIIDSKGKLLGKHRKMYLWNGEKERFSKGQVYEIFKLKFKEISVKIGLQICYELGFGEGARILALKGAEILVYPSAFGKARAYNWDLLSRARALENSSFVLACNLSGAEFAGNSRIISPQGKIIKNAKKDNECIIAELDLNEIKEQKQAVPYLKDFDEKLTGKAFLKL